MAENPNNDQNNQERYKELERLIGDQEGRIQNIQNSAFQLANYYFVFQGVVLAAIANSSTLTCSDVWYIFTLSIIAATLNLFALLSIGTKYVRSLNMHDETWAQFNALARNQHINPDQEQLHIVGVYSPANNNNNINNAVQRVQENNNVEHPLWRDPLALAKRYGLLTVCMVLFLGFAIVTLSGPWRIICKHDAYGRRHDKDLDCLKLCNGSRCMHFCQGG